MPDPTFGIATAIGVSGVAGAAATMSAADAQAKAARKAQDTQWRMYLQQREDMTPWREAGAGALRDLQSALEGGPGAYEQSPDYQMRLKEGQKAIDAAAAYSGAYGSGSHLKALTQYGQDLASSDYDRFLNRWMTTKIAPLQSLAGLGQSSAHALASAAGNYADNASTLSLAQGDIRASSYGSMGNIFGDVVSQGINAYGAGLFNSTPAARATNPLVTYSGNTGYGVR